MPYSYNLAIIITHGFSVGRCAGSVIFFTHTRGSRPRLLAAAPSRGLFSSAHGSAVRKINTCERKRAELLSPGGARIIAGGVAAVAA